MIRGCVFNYTPSVIGGIYTMSTTIVQDLQRATTAINSIESKLKSKGVIGAEEIVPIEDYPSKIDEISGGGGSDSELNIIFRTQLLDCTYIENINISSDPDDVTINYTGGKNYEDNSDPSDLNYASLHNIFRNTTINRYDETKSGKTVTLKLTAGVNDDRTDEHGNVVPGSILGLSSVFENVDESITSPEIAGKNNIRLVLTPKGVSEVFKYVTMSTTFYNAGINTPVQLVLDIKKAYMICYANRTFANTHISSVINSNDYTEVFYDPGDGLDHPALDLSEWILEGVDDNPDYYDIAEFNGMFQGTNFPDGVIVQPILKYNLNATYAKYAQTAFYKKCNVGSLCNVDLRLQIAIDETPSSGYRNISSVFYNASVEQYIKFRQVPSLDEDTYNDYYVYIPCYQDNLNKTLANINVAFDVSDVYSNIDATQLVQGFATILYGATDFTGGCKFVDGTANLYMYSDEPVSQATVSGKYAGHTFTNTPLESALTALGVNINRTTTRE